MKILESKILSLFILALFALSMNAEERKTQLKTEIDSIFYASGVKFYEKTVKPALASKAAYRNPEFFVGDDKKEVYGWNSKYMTFFMYGVLDEKVDVELEYSMSHKENQVLAMGEAYRKDQVPAWLKSVQEDFKLELTEDKQNEALKLIFLAMVDSNEEKSIIENGTKFFDDKKFYNQYGISIEGLKEREDNYLTENKKKKGVKTIKSGVQYKEIVKGEGKSPRIRDSVVVNYEGVLLNGRVFDSSIRRGEPSTFAVGDVIMGWVEALLLMQKGSKWEIVVPNKEAYGTRGLGNNIPPYSTLLFDVEIIDIIRVEQP